MAAEKLEDIFKLCDQDPNHHQFTLRKSYHGFEPWFDSFLKGEETYQPYLSDMGELQIPREEALFILAYTGTHSSWLNQDLREGEPLSSPCKETFAASLDAVLEKMNSFNDQLVYRMDIPPEDEGTTLDWFEKHIGAKINIPYFLSTSKEDFHNTPIVWEIKTLAASSFGKDISRLTNNYYEKEVLFKRNSKFEILAIDRDINYVKMTEISQDEACDFSLTGMYTRNL